MTQDGMLLGYPKKAMAEKVKATVTDSSSKMEHECTITMQVRDTRRMSADNADFALRILQVALSPEIVLDDEWFETLNVKAAAVLFDGMNTEIMRTAAGTIH